LNTIVRDQSAQLSIFGGIRAGIFQEKRARAVNMHTARQLKHSTYLCVMAVVAAAAFGPLAAVPFLPVAAVLCWLAIKATSDDDAPPLQWGILFDREILIGCCAFFAVGFVLLCWSAAHRIVDDGWLASVWAATEANPDMLPPTWLLAVLVGIAFLIVCYYLFAMLIWLADFDFRKWRAELVARFQTWWAELVARFLEFRASPEKWAWLLRAGGRCFDKCFGLLPPGER
jgi:hypothetical protein